jgi:hypothetical protein
MKTIALLYPLFVLFLSSFTNACIDINTTSITNILNTSYHHNCYDHTIQHKDCCEYFMIDSECIDTYKNCVEYEDYVLNNLIHGCHSHNESINNIEYSDKCHQFTLQLESYCCDDMYQGECLDWYTQCNTFNSSDYDDNNCTIPTKYTNDYCRDYTQHIEHSCCHFFDDKCVLVYEWCMNNHPNETSALDLYIGPRHGHTIGINLMFYDDLNDINECAQLCIETNNCKSFDFIFTLNHCYLSNHVLGDIVNGNPVELVTIDNYYSVHYEKIINMPYHNTLCNVQYITWLGDGLCDMNGGYNTPGCMYDAGDCCAETCKDHLFYCGAFGYNCRDPEIVGYPSPAPTKTPTDYPTYSPSHSPTITPSTNPSISPTSSPTSSPTINPSLSPSTSIPTNSPSIQPTEVLSTQEPTEVLSTQEPTEASSTQEPTTSLVTHEPTEASSTQEPTTASSTQEPTSLPTNKNIIDPSKSKDNDNDDDSNKKVYGSGVIAALSVLIVLLFAILLGVVYKLMKVEKQAKISKNYPPPVHNTGFSNPMYSSNTEVNTNQQNTDDTDYDDSINEDDIIDEDELSIHETSGNYNDIYDDPSMYENDTVDDDDAYTYSDDESTINAVYDDEYKKEDK